MGIFRRNQKSQIAGRTVNEDWPSTAANGFVVLDVETTGLSPTGDRIIELGLIRTDSRGNPLGYWSTFINPERPVSATEVHGISDDDVLGAPTFEECSNEFLSKIKGQVLVAHNASFDHSFIRAALARAGWELPEIPVICTMLESRNFLPGLSRKRLVDCAEALGIDQPVQHRALSDASLASAIFHFYLNGPVDLQRSAELRELVQIGDGVSWPTERTFPAIKQVIANNSQWRTNPAQKTQSSLLESVSLLMPEDLLAEDASSSEISYALILLESLNDGIVSDLEIIALRDCADSMGIDSNSILNIHSELLLALSREAWRDGVVNRAEKQDILDCAQQLGLSNSEGMHALKEIETFRNARVVARVKPLPDFWELGEVLHVGDRVVITGCYEVGRSDMEKKARSLGVRITGSVSGKTTMLVSDGSIGGNKDADARRLGIRIVGPAEFKQLMEYVQPQLEVGKNLASTDVTEIEHLICTKCTKMFERQVAKGRKPHFCPNCR